MDSTLSRHRGKHLSTAAGGGRSLLKLIASIGGALVFACLLGVRHELRVTTEDTPFGPVDIPTRVTQVNLLPAILGIVLGGVGGYFASIILLCTFGRCSGRCASEQRQAAAQKAHHADKPEESSGRGNSRNAVLFAEFIGVAALVWLFLFTGALLAVWYHLVNIYQAIWVLNGFILVSGVIAWLIVGHKIVLAGPWRRRLDLLLRGPFTRFRVRWLNEGQQQIIWIGTVVEMLLCLFPPWVGYVYLSNGQPDGQAEFLGFHFFALSEYRVLGESAYIAARISYELLGWICLSVAALCGMLLLVYRGAKVE